MTSHVLRIASGLAAALITAALIKFALLITGLASNASPAPVTDAIWTAAQAVFAYGSLPAVLFVLASELLRLRSAAAHIALGLGATFLAALLAARGESLTSPVFAGGTLAGFVLLATAVFSALVYWAVSGRHAGWRGESAEHAELTAAEAFRTASVNAEVRYCKECAAGWVALGMLAFLVLSWVALGFGGLGDRFTTEAERQGNAVLQKSGYSWAHFKISGGRGVISGNAPDDAQKYAAFNGVQDALSSVTGFPGVISSIDNVVLASATGDGLAKQLADATRRENKARASEEAQRIAADAAKAAEAEAKLRAAELEAKHRQELESAQKLASTDPRAVQAAVPQPGPTPDAQPETPAANVQTAVTEEGDTPASDVAPSAEDVGAIPQPVEPVAVSAEACTSQDLAMIESSKVHFETQRFDVSPDYGDQMNRLASSALACPQQFIVVTGYADGNTDSLFNRSLGLQRAETVRDGLVARGVPATQISARTLGALEGGNDDQRAMNRRAEFRLASASEMSRDASLGPDERATKCEGDLSDIMAQSIIHFPTASANVSTESLGLIKKLARSIRTCGSVIVTVEGHTDKTGDRVFNQQLSEARANTVREALIAAGADTTRLASRGFASSQPFDPGNNSQAYALNRRIEFKVSGKFTSSNTGGP